MRLLAAAVCLTVVNIAFSAPLPRRNFTPEPAFPNVAGHYLGGRVIEQEGQSLHVRSPCGGVGRGYVTDEGTVVLLWTDEECTELHGIHLLRLNTEGDLAGLFCPIVDGAVIGESWPAYFWRCAPGN